MPAPQTQTLRPRDHWKSSTGSDLYLATFLTTLCLLLFASCAILLRCILVRRRLRRHLRAPLFADSIATPHPPRRRKRRPKFHDLSIAPAAGSTWHDTMPLSLRFVLGKRSPKPDEPKREAKTETRRFGLKTWSCCPHDSEDPASSPTRFEIAQVSVLIEMPSLHHSALYGDDHEALPELVLGYARCYKHHLSLDFATNDETEEKDYHPTI